MRWCLNFAPAPTKFPLIDVVAAVEEGARKLKGVEAEDLRGRVCGILRRAKLPQDNLTKGTKESTEGVETDRGAGSAG